MRRVPSLARRGARFRCADSSLRARSGAYAKHFGIVSHQPELLGDPGTHAPPPRILGRRDARRQVPRRLGEGATCEPERSAHAGHLAPVDVGYDFDPVPPGPVFDDLVLVDGQHSVLLWKVMEKREATVGPRADRL